MNVWDRQPQEKDDAYKGFSYFLECGNRSDNVGIAETVGANERKIKDWKIRYRWFERAASYDKWKEELKNENAEALFREEAYKFGRELFTNIQRLLLENSIYIEKLTKSGGIDQLKALDVLDLRDNSNENLELLAKIVKPYKEVMIMTPEGRKLLGEDEDKGDRIIIIEAPVTSKPKEVENEVVEEIEFEEVKKDGGN